MIKLRKLSKYKLIKKKRIPYKKMFKLRIRKTTGFKVKPKNKINYDGVEVNKLLILKKLFISNLLKKKIKRKLNLYLDLIIDIADCEDSSNDSEALRESLNELSRFKDIVRYKYKKYLDAKYIKLLLKKIELMEYELKEKYVDSYYEKEEKYEYNDSKTYNYIPEDELEEEKDYSTRLR